jgi:hypothetical protein
VNATVALLAARAPRLRKAVRDAKKAGHVRMSGIQRRRRLGDDLPGPGKRQQPERAEQRPGIAALYVAHRYVHDPGRTAGLVDGKDVRVAYLGGRPHLVKQPGPEGGVQGPAPAQGP